MINETKKKIFIIYSVFILIVFILLFSNTNVYAKTLTLEEVCNSFNNCSTVEEYAKYGSILKATSNGNKLTLTATADGTTTSAEYILENSILSANFSGDDETIFAGLVMNNVLIDSIGQLQGYSDGELFTTLNSDQISTYTVENEGFEIKEISDKNYTIKIDINKKIPLIDVSDEYIEVSDLQDLKSYILGDGSAEQRKGNIWFHKSGYEGENTLLIAEKDTITENTYKSILSLIEVMFDSNKAADYFKANYSGMSVGNKEFTGFNVEINPSKDEFEKSIIQDDSGYKFVRITISKEKAISEINRISNEDEVSSESDIKNTNENVMVQSILPKTGEKENIYEYLLYFIIASSLLTIVFLVFTPKKNRN